MVTSTPTIERDSREPSHGPLWELTGVSVGERLLDVSITVEPGITAVLGASGAGKSSLLDLLCEFAEPTKGQITANFKPNIDRSEGVSLLWAGHGDGLWPQLRAKEQISAVGGDPADWLPRFDLSERREAYPRVLSQGERARLELARALAAKPTILVMDEPLTHVDRRRTALGWAMIEQWATGNESHLIVATHDIAAARSLAQHVICMSDGRVVDSGPLERVLADPKCEATAWAVGAEGAFA